MASPLQQFRSRYPQYNDLEDDELADRLHQTFYQDMGRDEFRQRVGLSVPPSQPPPSAADRLDRQLTAPDDSGDPFQPVDDQLGEFVLDRLPQRVLFEDWEAEARGDLNNSLRGLAERGSHLFGHTVRGVVGRPGAALGDGSSVPGQPGLGLLNRLMDGRIAFGTDWGPDDPADGKFRVRWMWPQEWERAQRDRGAEDYFLQTVPEYYIDQDLGYRARNTPEQIKTAYHNGEIGGTLGAVLKFGLEQGIASIPDMVMVMSGVGTGLYVGARSDEIGAERAKNKGLEAMTGQEQLEALPAAFGSALFEKFGAKYIFGRFGANKTAEALGQEMMEAGLKAVAQRVGKESAKAAGVEAATEFFQEGVIEYLGETLGTDAPTTWEEGLERGFFGGLGGGIAGGTLGGLAAGAGETTRALADRQAELYIADPDHVVTTEPTTGAEPDVVPASETGGGLPPPATGSQTPIQSAAAAPPGADTQADGGDADFYIDPRLKRELFRYNLAGLAEQITVEGSNTGMTDRQMKRAVEKALTGQALGIREAKIVRSMLDRISGQRTSPAVMDWARDRLTDARDKRRRLRQDLAADTELEPIDAFEESHAGELFAENEYLPDMDADARIVDEMAAWLDYAGYEAEADRILDSAEDTADAMQQLEALQNTVRKAYHGTPHTVEKFSVAHIGTGEGAQAAGWGLYFAELPETARFYQKEVGYAEIARNFLDAFPEDADVDDVQDIVDSGVFNAQQARFLEALQSDDFLGFDHPAQAITTALKDKNLADHYDASPELLKAIDELSNLYEVQIPSDERLLDRDATYEQQPAAVKQALDEYMALTPNSEVKNVMDRYPDAPLGLDIYNAVVRDIRKEIPVATSEEAQILASQRLQFYGIPGSRYLDAMSRDPDQPASEKSYNYVIWDDSLIDIVAANEQIATAPRQESPAPAPVQPPAADVQTAQPAPDDRRTETRGTDRRQDVTRRQRVASMTPEQLVDELYTDPLTGLNNERAFNEDLSDATAVVSIDVDGLGGVNDNLGHDAGDWLLQAVGHVLGNVGARAYHKSGDEFYLLGDNVQELTAAAEDARRQLERQVLETAKGEIKGINITTGAGTTKADADAVMEASKKERERQGLRSQKGQLPPGAVLYSQVMDWNPGENYVDGIGMTGELPMDPDGNYQLGNGKTVRLPRKAVRRHHILRRLERSFGNKIYQGRVKGKSRLGYYRKAWGEIRIKNANDLETTAHEFGHWLDDRFPWIGALYKRYKKEMRGISYDKDKLYEGYAEFMRHWFVQEHIVREAAPGFYDEWMAALDEHSEIRDAVFDIQEMMHAWHLQGARKRLRDRIDRDIPLLDRFRDATRGWSDRLIQKLFDDLRRFKTIERSLAGTGAVAEGEVLKASSSAYASLRLLRGAHGVMRSVFHRGTINWNTDGDLEFTGKGLEAIFAPVSDRMRDMMLYMVARRAYELKKQGRENLIRNDEIVSGLRLGEENPDFVEVFDEWLAFNTRMMDFYQASGLLDSQTRKKIEEMNKNYVPFNRVVESALGETRVKRGGGPFVRLKGGTSNINDVYENIIGNTAHLIQMALTNHAKLKFYQMLARSDNQTAALYAAPIPKDTKAVNINREQVEKVILDTVGMTRAEYRLAKETGMFSDPEEAALIDMIDDMFENLDDFVTFFTFGHDPQGDVDFVFDGGKKTFFEIADPLLWDSLQHVGPRTHNLALGFLGGFANLLRRGVTATPTFQARNFIRDTMNAFTLSKGQMVPVAGASQALLERLYNDEHYWEYMVNGGGFASAVEASGLNRERVIDSRHKIMRAFDETLAAAEYANRLAEFKKLRQQGWTARDATLAGREISTDFAMRGSSEILRYFITSIPFLNARLQGLYRNGRELARMQEGKLQFAGKQAFSYALRALMAITIPSLGLYLLNRDDERYQELPDWVRDLNWVIFTGDGEDDYWLIPKPFETGFFWGSVPERTVEAIETDDNRELADALLWMALETFQLDLVPQFYKPYDELRVNKNFTGAPIIPEYLEDVEPSEQYRSYTSDAMIALGRRYNISPLAAEHLVRGYMGTWGAWAMGAADMMVGDINNSGEQPTKDWESNILVSPFVNDGPLRRTHSENHLYDMLKETREVVNTVRQISRRSPDRVEQYIGQPKKQILEALNASLEAAARDMRDLNNAMDEIRADPALSGDTKRAMIHELQRAKNQIARETYRNINPQEVDRLIQEAEAQLNRSAVNE